MVTVLTFHNLNMLLENVSIFVTQSALQVDLHPYMPLITCNPTHTNFMAKQAALTFQAGGRRLMCHVITKYNYGTVGYT